MLGGTKRGRCSNRSESENQALHDLTLVGVNLNVDPRCPWSAETTTRCAVKIALLTLGTRGDTQPFIALGRGLVARGHQVVLGAPENHKDWVESHGLAFRSIGVDMRAFVESVEGRRVMAGNPLAMARLWRNQIVPLTRESLDATWDVSRDADAIVYHPKTAGGADVGEATGACTIHAAPFPVFPTKSFPLFVLPGNYGPWLNRLSYAALLFSRLVFLPTVNRWRREVLGLRRARSPNKRARAARRGATQLCAVSASVLPDYPATASEHIHTTGYWFLDEGADWQPDAELAAFLANGAAPIYIGFGSMSSVDPVALSRTVVEAVRRSGLRAILASGWGALGEPEPSDSVYTIEGAPHLALFRHVSAVVHHGGSGTTAAGLRAGLPTLVCPLTVDQPFWGRRVHKLGCGPKPQSIKHLRPGRLAAGLGELVTTGSYRRRAEEIAEAISREDGVGRAIELIEEAASGALRA